MKWLLIGFLTIGWPFYIGLDCEACRLILKFKNFIKGRACSGEAFENEVNGKDSGVLSRLCFLCGLSLIVCCWL